MKSSKSRKKYKAIIFDIDGTLIPNKIDALPSEKVRKSIAKASTKIHIGVATSRPAYLARPILDHLKLSGPSILHGGAEITDLTTGKIFFKETIAKSTLIKIYKITKKYGYRLYIDEENTHSITTDKYPFKDSGGAVVMGLDMDQSNRLAEILNNLGNVMPHRIPSWEKDKIDVGITPVNATKQLGILRIAEILKISTEDIIGVGDGYNDFPLLMACGLKIAMGNAVSEIKEIADYIAPSVQDDGAADIIEKFVL